MRYQRLPGLPALVSALGVGCNNFGSRLDEVGALKVINSALESGVTLFDTADTYGDRGGSERILGKALGEQTEDVIVATKFGYAGVDMGYGGMARGSAKYIRTAIHRSLERLKRPCVDIYYVHSPDLETPLVETLTTLQALMDEGSIRSYGLSNHSAERIQQVVQTAEAEGIAKPLVVQNRYSLLERSEEREVLPLCVRNGIFFVPYWPLENGILTGKLSSSGEPPVGSRLTMRPSEITAERLSKVYAIESWAESRSQSILQVSLEYLLSQDSVISVIPGAMTASQVVENVAASGLRLNELEVGDLRKVLDEL